MLGQSLQPCYFRFRHSFARRWTLQHPNLGSPQKPPNTLGEPTERVCIGAVLQVPRRQLSRSPHLAGSDGLMLRTEFFFLRGHTGLQMPGSRMLSIAH